MKKVKLKKKLEKHFSSSTVRSLLNGTRLPSMKKAISLYQEEQIPLKVWVDVSSYINNSTPKEAITSLQKEHS